ncbi:FtsH protease regulator HflK [compost metagenome]
MQQIYGNVTKVLVDSSKGSNLLYLPLDKIMQNSGQGAAAADAASTAATPVPGATTVPSPMSNEVRARDNSRSRERDAR